MTDRHIDDAIDRAVREMMAVDAPIDLQGRVLSRLGRAEQRLFTWPLLAAAAAAALVVTIALMQTLPTDSPVQVVTAPNPVAPPVWTSVMPQPDVREASRDRRHGHRPARESGRMPTVAQGMPETIPALEDIQPLVVPPPQPRKIEPENITIAPLADIPEI